MMSKDEMSAQHTSHFVIPILLRLFPHMVPALVWQIHLVVRKAMHVIEYGVLGVLLWRAIPEHKTTPEVTDWGRAGVSLLVATCYGATDEFHQIFVPSRGASVHDVLIDACGAGFALGIVCLINLQRPRRSNVGAETQATF